MGSGQNRVPIGAPGRKARGGLIGLALLAVISLAAWLGPAGGDNPAEANHSTVAVGIDTDTAGNTALALGTLQACRVISLGQVIEVDLYVTGLSDIAAFDSYIAYDTSKLNISEPGSSNQGHNNVFYLQQAQPSPPGNSFTNTSEVLPDSANPGDYRVGGYDTAVIPGYEDPDPIGHTHKDGVLVRLKIQGIANGFSPLQISPHDGVGINIKDSTGNINVGDGADSDVFVDTVINGSILIGSGTCTDGDGDGIPDASDNCPTVANPTQANFDFDSQGDACDADDDNDGLIDTSEAAGCTLDTDCDNDLRSDGTSDPDGGGPIVAGPDNCVTTANANQLNTDADALGDACDPDDDNDGILDGADNCPLISNFGQGNMDGDSLGDACDLEDDGDGFDDTAEAWLGTNPMDNCGSHTTTGPIYSLAWPGDVYSVSPSTNKMTLQDVTSFLAPLRRYNTNPGDAAYHLRWDIKPGSGGLQKAINLQDITSLIAGPSAYPLMFGGLKALNYATPCTP